jgi:lysophospholipase L1-like esterase
VDDEILNTPARSGGDLFARYVALGNSITAGWQSGGMNDSTQLRAYPVFLARQANAPFEVPLLARPGCPPPLTAPFGTARVTTNTPPGTPAGTTCFFRTTTAPRQTQNFAVPDATIQSPLNGDVAANALTTFILGGRTQIQAAQAAQPTLLSMWLGNNDVLGAAVSGNPALLTPLATFQTSLAGIADSLRAIPTLRDVIMIGVVDVTVIPLLQTGPYFFYAAAATGGRFGGPTGKLVNANCATSTNLVSIRILADANFPEVNCSNEAYPVGDPRRGIHVLTPDEATAIATRVSEYNNALRSRAEANGWIYLDPVPVLRAASNNLQDPSRIRKCQTLPAALQTGTQAAITTAITNTCPSTAPAVGFGSLFSFDGLHPSTLAHQIIANALIDALNAKHTISIPRITV